MRYLVVAALCVLAYLPSVSIPLLEDDYPNLYQALSYGNWDGLVALMGDATFRLRATSYWLMNALWWPLRSNAAGYHAVSLGLHILCSWLVYKISRERKAAVWAAAFFAVHEGHQEAVMWFSAVNELLMFVFGAAALLVWRSAVDSRRQVLHVPSLLLFALALVSKESAVIFLPLLVLVSPTRDLKRLALAVLPYTLLAGLAIVSVLTSSGESFRFADGSFSLRAPFWITLPNGIVRLLWPWGFASALLLGGFGRWRPIAFSLVWMLVSFAPYSFLTYSTAIPSRQTYLASAGLAFLVGEAFATAAEHTRRPLVYIAAAIVLSANVYFLWTKKRQQFLARAEPTEQLLRLARNVQPGGDILIRCFPRQRIVAEDALRLITGPSGPRLIWEPNGRKPAAVFCYQER